MSRRRHQWKMSLGVEQLERREMLSAGSWGAYGLLANGISDDFQNDFAQAAPVNLASTGSGSQSGRIEQAFDVDMFQFVAPVTGQMTIREVAPWGSRLDPYLYVYDAHEQLIAQNDDDGTSLNSRVAINVRAGETYYVKAAGYGRTRDAYRILFATTALVTDDFGNTFNQAKQVELSPSGSSTESGRIEQSGDMDMFSFVATVTGHLTITQSATSGSRLDSYLYAYDADGKLLGQNDDTGYSQDSRVEISVVAGSTYFIKAAAYQRSTGAYTLAIETVEAQTGDTGTTTSPGTGTNTQPTGGDTGFQIDVTMTGFTAAQQAIVQQAVDLWEQIIVGDLPDVSYFGQAIDDLAITISSIQIDGRGNILGQAAATAFRRDSHLPYLGFIQLDTSDVASLERSGSLLGVITHEMAHVLGFGVIWSDLGLLTGSRTSNPGFTGARAVAEYNALFGTHVTAVPVEADGGAGTALSHWEESVLANELMTGWYNSGQTNPVSRITVASLADIGYQVNMNAAQSYRAASSSVAASAALSNANANSLFGSTNDPSWHGRHRSRVQGIDQVMASLSMATSPGFIV